MSDLVTVKTRVERPVMDALTASAARNERSVAAEVRFALTAHLGVLAERDGPVAVAAGKAAHSPVPSSPSRSAKPRRAGPEMCEHRLLPGQFCAVCDS